MTNETLCLVGTEATHGVSIGREKLKTVVDILLEVQCVPTWELKIKKGLVFCEPFENLSPGGRNTTRCSE